MKNRFALVLALSLGLGAPAAAQTAAARLIEQARVQLDGLNGDSARVLLAAGLDRSPTPAERLRGFTLLGFAQLLRKDLISATRAFDQALRLDPTLRVDSLAVDLGSEAPPLVEQRRPIIVAAINAARELEASRPPVQLLVGLSTDTTLAGDDVRLPINVVLSARARVISSIVAADAPDRAIWADTQMTLQRQVAFWPLRRADGTVLPAGRYLLRVHAVDSTDRATPVEQRALRVARIAVDTQVPPPALTAAAFVPETVQVGHKKFGLLASGGSLAALIAVAPAFLGNPSLNAGLSGDPTAYAVSGGVALASVVGFIKGRPKTQLSLPNVQRNQQLREDDRRRREGIAAANAAARLKAPIRVTVERSP
jgi:hypothetical protein